MAFTTKFIMSSPSRLLSSPLLALLCGAAWILPLCAPAATVYSVTVDVTRIAKELSPYALGLNVNYLLDDPALLPSAPPLAGVLSSMGMRILRYPGGEKSDSYLWSIPPFSRPFPALARKGPGEWPAGDPLFVRTGEDRLKGPVLDFDEFIALCRQAGAEPSIVIAFDSMYKPASPGGSAPTRQQLLDTAVAWVRYANVERGYGVKFWELGNESYLSSSYNGTAPSAQSYADDVKLFAQAMKAVDPTIHIGANGHDRDWWKTVLESAVDSIDFLAVHAYPVQEWDAFQSQDGDFTRSARIADRAIAEFGRAADRERLRIAITETGVLTFQPGRWPNINDLGHALVLFEIIGQHLSMARVDWVETWNTRYTSAPLPYAQYSLPQAWDALDARNAPLAHGTVLALWGRFMDKHLYATTAEGPLAAYAAGNLAEGKLNLMLLNREGYEQTAKVALIGVHPRISVATRLQFSGDNEHDTTPQISSQPAVPFENGEAMIRLAPLSVTVLSISP